jgi:hypothetical protein
LAIDGSNPPFAATLFNRLDQLSDWPLIHWLGGLLKVRGLNWWPFWECWRLATSRWRSHIRGDGVAILQHLNNMIYDYLAILD